VAGLHRLRRVDGEHVRADDKAFAFQPYLFLPAEVGADDVFVMGVAGKAAGTGVMRASSSSGVRSRIMLRL
jgi:hypothetical protein